MKVTCSRKLHFCAGHRVMGHENKCAKLHGHNYIVWVHAESEKLDDIGRVIDFSVLKERIGGWIEECWDHKMILNHQDPLIRNEPGWDIDLEEWGIVLVVFNPTAENMANYLLIEICPDLLRDTGVFVSKIEIYETENCMVVAEL